MGFAPLGIDESLNLRRYLNGQIISQIQFVAFTAKVKSAVALSSSLATTEDNWQAEKALSKFGQVGKFVIDDENQTIRLPAVVNPQGLLELSGIGNLVNESLPNITGDLGACLFSEYSGAFEKTTQGTSLSSGAGETFYGDFDASRSSTAYQNDAPVQQEAIQYPYYIQVATGIQEELPAIREYGINTPFFFGWSQYFENAPYNASLLASNGQYNASSLYPDLWSQLQVELNASLNVGDMIEISGKTYVKRGLPVVLSTDTYDDYDWVVNESDSTFRLPLLNGSEDLLGDRKTSLTLGTSGSSEIAPANGFYCLHASNNTSSLEIYVGTSTNFTLHTTTQDDSGWNGVFVKVSKGDRITYYYAGTGTPDVFQFIYAKGNGTLYYYVGDIAQDASLINAGAALSQLSDKISRTTASDKELVVSWGMPDYTAGVSITSYTSSSNKFTAPCDGVILCGYLTTSDAGLPFVDAMSFGSRNDSSIRDSVSILINKGQQFYCTRMTSVGVGSAYNKFYPLKGVS